MPSVKINDKEYDFDSLSDDAKSNLASLQFVQSELKRLEAKLAVFKTSEAAYARALDGFLPKGE